MPGTPLVVRSLLTAAALACSFPTPARQAEV